MTKLSQRTKAEMVFFINDQGRIEYNKTCMMCTRECKQSFRAELISCPLFTKKGDE